jgi:hypothetical protein
VIISIKEEDISEVEAEEISREEDMAILTNGKKTISINESKEEVETILVLPIMAKEEDITTKREQIIVVSTMESLGTKPLIADRNIEKTCQKIHIKIPVSLVKVHIVYF